MRLKVGDRIYQESYNEIRAIYIIDRVTNCFAFAGNNKFKIEYNNNGRINKAEQSTWVVSSYSLETPELKEQLRRQLLISKFTHFVFKTLSTEQLVLINNIIEQNNDK